MAGRRGGGGEGEPGDEDQDGAQRLMALMSECDCEVNDNYCRLIELVINQCRATAQTDNENW